MGAVKDLLLSASSNKELRAMTDKAREQYNDGYIKFLEEELEKAEKKVFKLLEILKEKNN